MMKRILVAFLIPCVYLSAWSWTGSGTKEDPWVLTNTMTAVLDDEGTLTIRGTGDMPNGGYSLDVTVGDDIRRVTFPWESISSALQAVVIDIGVRSVGNYAFTNCSNLASVKISEGVESIGGYAFKGCTRLASVTIPKGVTSITMGAFEDCTNLASVMFCSNVSRNGIMLSRPISRSIFYGCTSLTSVVFAKGVTRIGDNLLGDCTSLTSVTIPEGVTDIGGGAFSGCTSLASVTLPKGVMNIEEAAFDGCTSLASVSIPEGVSNIGWYAFRGCASLVSVTISEGVTNIQGNAFEDCDSLMSVTIPEGVMGIGYGAFKGCDHLKSVAIPASLSNIEDYVFKDCSNLTDVTIAEGVREIGSGMFAGCSSLRELVLPSSLKVVNSGAFGYCYELDSLTFTGDAPECGVDVFNEASCDMVVYVKRGTKGWTDEKGNLKRRWPHNTVSGRPLCYIGEEYQGGSSGGSSTGGLGKVYLTVTNVVVQYVTNSVEPAFANPPTADTGFVNIITEVKGGAVAIPSSWAENYPAFESKFGSDFTQALSMKTGKKDGAGNDMFVWQDYVAGTDPTKTEDKFTASITVVDGKVTVSYTPELDDARNALRKYTTWGKKSLLDANWTVVQEGQEAEYNFFKVSVEMK